MRQTPRMIQIMMLSLLGFKRMSGSLPALCQEQQTKPLLLLRLWPWTSTRTECCTPLKLILLRYHVLTQFTLVRQLMWMPAAQMLHSFELESAQVKCALDTGQKAAVL